MVTVRASVETADDELLPRLRAWGYNATSYQTLGPQFSRWRSDDGGSVVAYADTGAAWVAAGAPIGPEADFERVVPAFTAAAARRGRRACFFGTEARFRRTPGVRAMPVGLQPCWEPAAWSEVVRTTRSLREQLRRGRSAGVVVSEVPVEALVSGPLRDDVLALLSRWQDQHGMAPMGFLVAPGTFVGLEARRAWAARDREGRLVGFVSCAPIYARDGWLVEPLLREPSAPNGTVDLLIDAVMRAAEGRAFVTLGLAPLTGPVPAWMRWVGRAGKRWYDFEGLAAFKTRLRPTRWDPIDLCWTGAAPAPLVVWDVLRAFAGEDLVGFGVRSLVR